MIQNIKIKKIYLCFVLTTILLTVFSCKQEKKTNLTEVSPKENTSNPNIVIIYLDDLGYGDLSAYGATELSTPNIDKLANGGVKFTNAYATSATCTPSRYGLLTGVYPWRNKDAQILPGTAPLIINPEQTTIPKMLKQQGYTTGIVGKWHLGLGTGHVNWNDHVSPGPNEVGFDYSYIMAATQDRVPTVYIKNGRVDNLDPNDPIEVNYAKNFEGEPTGKDNPELTKMKWHHGHNNSIVNGIPRIGFMTGGESAKWSDVDMADHFLVEAQNYVKQHKENPFFLYYALQQPHVPRTPHPRFVGKSGMGPRGDVILEADWIVGEFIKTLEKEQLLENTLIIFTSDNGPVLNDGYYDDAVEKLGNHKPAGALRGGKYSLFDAGTHVPFFTYWKGKITPSVSDALICQVDLLSSLAKLTASNIKTEDSDQLIDVLLGNSKTGKTNLIIEAGQKTALRSGNWVMIPPYKGNPINTQVNIELGISSEFQLYNLKEDHAQKNNLAQSNPEKLDELTAIYKKIRGKTEVEIKELELK
ncbi:arylsulfatase [Formosa agariphila KMM 3901]|uniref:Arylsulfatase n=1 Tax=Formosa agariphila (strain DSM 15362 / KCTC 12365 / LMG 23005 / KMM 3901 / M-2Alg 35-1) TaxID=1347342 RepID=T2KN04_FORAG|nr:arylsulfatase [Formosa agariphila]CDF79801.1 arylsulfatase [Formosa agariphila KMM 3901]